MHLLGEVGYTTTDPRNVEEMNISRFQDYGLGSRRKGLFPFLGEGIFTHDGPAWKHDRELLRRQFARTQSQNLDTFEEPVETLIASFEDSFGTVDLQPAFFHFTLSTSTGLLFGEAVHSLPEDQSLEFGDAFDYASYVAAVRLRLADLCFAYTPRKFLKSCDTVFRYANLFVQRALDHQKEHGTEKASVKYPFVLELYSELQDSTLVRDQLVNVLLAGRGTTASTLSWVFFLLVRHPRVFADLKAEVASITEGRPKFTRNDIRRMPYLKAVLDETLRLYPQVPVNVRFTVCSTLLPKGGGPDGESPIFLPKGTGVGLSTYHLHRSKDLYGQDADDFRPERWLTGELDNIGHGYLPFWDGRRTCLGKDFALTEASYAIVRMIQSYPDIHLPSDLKPEPVGQEPQSLTLVVSSAEGCKVVLR